MSSIRSGRRRPGWTRDERPAFLCKGHPTARPPHTVGPTLAGHSACIRAPSRRPQPRLSRKTRPMMCRGDGFSNGNRRSRIQNASGRVGDQVQRDRLGRDAVVHAGAKLAPARQEERPCGPNTCKRRAALGPRPRVGDGACPSEPRGCSLVTSRTRSGSLGQAARCSSACCACQDRRAPSTMSPVVTASSCIQWE